MLLPCEQCGATTLFCTHRMASIQRSFSIGDVDPVTIGALLVTENVDETGTHWGLSFDGPNPADDQYVPCLSKEDAFKLKGLVEAYGQRIVAETRDWPPNSARVPAFGHHPGCASPATSAEVGDVSAWGCVPGCPALEANIAAKEAP